MKKVPRCPYCGEELPQDRSPYVPFCSRQCKDADLLKWLNGEYVIAQPIEDAELDGHGMDIEVDGE